MKMRYFLGLGVVQVSVGFVEVSVQAGSRKRVARRRSEAQRRLFSANTCTCAAGQKKMRHFLDLLGFVEVSVDV